MTNANERRRRLGFESLEGRRLLASLIARLPPIEVDLPQDPIVIYDASQNASPVSREALSSLYGLQRILQSEDLFGHALQQAHRESWSLLVRNAAEPTLVPSYERATELVAKGFTTQFALQSPFGAPLSSQVAAETSTIQTQSDSSDARELSVSTPPATSREETSAQLQPSGDQTGGSSPETDESSDEDSSAPDYDPESEGRRQPIKRAAPTPMVVTESGDTSTQWNSQHSTAQTDDPPTANAKAQTATQTPPHVDAMDWLPMQRAAAADSVETVAEQPENSQVTLVQMFIGGSAAAVTRWQTPIVQVGEDTAEPESAIVWTGQFHVPWVVAAAVAGFGYANFVRRGKNTETDRRTIAR